MIYLVISIAAAIAIALRVPPFKIPSGVYVCHVLRVLKRIALISNVARATSLISIACLGGALYTGRFNAGIVCLAMAFAFAVIFNVAAYIGDTVLQTKETL